MGKAFEGVNVAQSCADRETLQTSGLCGLGPAGLEAWSGPGTWGGGRILRTQQRGQRLSALPTPNGL
jgi:hypothetical protein